MRLWPLPRAVQLSIVLLLALISFAPAITAAPLVPDVLNVFGAAATFQVFGVGYAVEGAPYAWNDVCSYCWIRVTFREGQFLNVDADGGSQFASLLPGQYEIREYRGLFMFSQRALNDFAVELHGTGTLIRLS